MQNNKIAILIKKLDLKFDKIANPVLISYGFTVTQFKIIKYLYDNDDVIAMDLQKEFSLTNPTITGIINNMENNGWIRRVKNPLDSRSKIIKLTKKALDLKDEMYGIGDNFEKQFTCMLGKKEKDDLLKLLNKIDASLIK